MQGAAPRLGTGGESVDADDFDSRNAAIVRAMAEDEGLRRRSMEWLVAASRHEYSYHFTWMGRPIIQFPQDIVALQEVIWRVRPDLVVETGVARGGSLVFSASMLELLGGDGLVVGVDIDIRPHNRRAIEEHPLSRRIALIEGSSIDPEVVAQVRARAAGRCCVMVILDSSHTHDHVLSELRQYAPLVGSGSYLIVMDTIVEDMPADFFPDRPWCPGNNPKTAVRAFLRECDRFEVDRELEAKLLVSVAPEGYLRCVRD